MNCIDLLRTNIEKKELPTYVSGYPSKRAYRAFQQPLRIADVVQETARSKQINIYIHVPFCRYRFPPRELACGHKKSFSRGELEAIYTEAGWEIMRSDRYIKWDAHPGIPIHSHCIEEVVVSRLERKIFRD